jgi:CheY-like chemotaxis protein
MHKLLLADDSVTIQRVIELTFSGEDIHVIAVNDGEQAIARIPIEQPDIVLADIGMPKKGGYDVAAFVKGRAELEHIPVLLLAGAFEPVDQARAEQVRCDGVLIKPFEPRQVIERVRELLESMKGTPVPMAVVMPTPVAVPTPAPELTPEPVAIPVAVAPAPAAPPVQTPSPAPMPAMFSTEQTDAALDEYFESLNAAFDSVDAGAPAATIVNAPAVDPAPPATQQRRRGDSLDDYFDRLSTAFDQVRPPDTLDTPPDAFDEPIEERHVPTVAAIVGMKVPEKMNGNGHVNGHGAPRNPIVDALEAMLGRPASVLTQPTLPGLPEFSRDEEGPPATHEDLADTVTERVLDRLLPEITATVRRLVQEEVDRLQRN